MIRKGRGVARVLQGEAQLFPAVCALAGWLVLVDSPLLIPFSPPSLPPSILGRDPGELQGGGPSIHRCHPYVPPVEGAVRHLGNAVWERGAGEVTGLLEGSSGVPLGPRE